MRWRVMLTYVVRSVSVSRSPVDKKFILFDTVTYPIKSHVDSFCSFHFNAGVRKADGGGVVDLDGGGWLGMPHFFEAHTEGEGISCGEEGGADFRFCGGAHHVLHDFA